MDKAFFKVEEGVNNLFRKKDKTGNTNESEEESEEGNSERMTSAQSGNSISSGLSSDSPQKL